jgi:putative DNA primase/helicase
MFARNGEAPDSAKSKASKDTALLCNSQHGEHTTTEIAPAIASASRTDGIKPAYAAALHAQALGLDVMPLPPRSKAPSARGWSKRDPYTPEELRAHWGRQPTANYGIRCGRPIGDGSAGFLAVVDVDAVDPSALAEALAAAREWLGDDWSACPMVSSGGGVGLHLYYRTAEPVKSCVTRTSGETVTLPDGRTKQRWQLELKGRGSQVVGPGSVHPSGGTYQWAQELAPAAAPLLPPIPAHWMDKPKPQPVNGQPSASAGGSARRRLLSWLASCADAVRQAPEGERNDTLNKRAASAAGARVGGEGLDPGEVRSAMIAAALAAGLEEAESLATIASALRFAKANPFQLPDRPRPMGAAPSGDLETLACIDALADTGEAEAAEAAAAAAGEGEPPDPCEGLPCFELIEWQRGRRNGVYYCGLLKDKATGTLSPAPPVWVCDPLKIVAATRDVTGNAWGYLLEWRDGDGRLHRWACPAELLAGTGEELRAVLLGRGLRITPTPDRRLLADYLQWSRPGVKARSVQRTGWHGSVFVWPDATEGDSATEPTVLQVAQPDGVALGQGGTLAGWKREVAAPCAGNSRLVLALAVAFAGPGLALAGAEGGGLHFRGASSTGKSTALKIAGSVYGPPEYIRSWRATANGLEGTAALHSDLCLILDELGELPPRDAAAVGYMLAHGVGKARAARDGSARAPMTWRLAFLSSGEVGLADLIGETGGKVRAGQEVRFLDVPADAGVGLGLFDRLPAGMTAGQFADSLADASGRHYGHAGRAWVRWLVQHHAEARQSLRELRAAIAADLAPADAAGQVRRVAQRFALIAAAGELAGAAGVTGWPPGEAAAAAALCFKAWLGQRGTTGSAEPLAMLRQVRQFLEAHGESRFTPLDDDPKRDTVNRAGFRRSLPDGATEFIVLGEVFRQEVCKGFDPGAVAEALASVGALRCTEGRRTKLQRLPGFGAPIRVYVIGPELWSAGHG